VSVIPYGMCVSGSGTYELDPRTSKLMLTARLYTVYFYFTFNCSGKWLRCY